MVNEYNVPVKYTKSTTTVTTYDTGLTDWANIDDLYKDKILRDKVVCKADVSLLLSSYFEEGTIRKYRPVLMQIIKGLVTDPNKLSKCVIELIGLDSKFRASIQDIYNSCPEEECFGYYLMDVLAGVFKGAERTYRGFFRGKPEVVICISDGYLYFSVEDSKNVPTLPYNIDCEVLSYAKNWRGEFQFIE